MKKIMNEYLGNILETEGERMNAMANVELLKKSQQNKLALIKNRIEKAERALTKLEAISDVDFEALRKKSFDNKEKLYELLLDYVPTVEEIDEASEMIEKLQAIGLKANRWQKNGNDRIYVEGFHHDKTFYIDLVKKQAKANRPGAISDMKDILEKANINGFELL